MISGGSNPSVYENQNDLIVGDLVTVDDDINQSYRYTLINDAEGRFYVDGNKLIVSSTANLDFENSTEHTILLKSTDNGTPPMFVPKSFVVNVLDENEAPSSVLLDRYVVDSLGVGDVVANLSTQDPDNALTTRQTFSYEISDEESLGYGFSIDGDQLKVTQWVWRCLAKNQRRVCSEDSRIASTGKKYTIRVRSTDSGIPSKSIEATLSIQMNDAGFNECVLGKVIENCRPSRSIQQSGGTGERDREGAALSAPRRG